MPEIHPTAYVDRNVELAEDVIIGPQCVLEGRISIGAGTRLLHRVSLQGPLRIGQGNTIYPNACIGFSPQDLKFDPKHEGAGTVIGDRNIFREGVTIHRATGQRPTTIGSDNYFMCNSHAAHDVLLGNHVMLANGALLAGHVEVADRVILGGGAAVHQFYRIGRMTMVGGLSPVIKDIPPFCLITWGRGVAALNVIGLRRSGLGKHLAPLKVAFDLLFRSRLARLTAVERVRAEVGDDPLCAEMADFAEQAKRGIAPYAGNRGDVEETTPAS